MIDFKTFKKFFIDPNLLTMLCGVFFFVFLQLSLSEMLHGSSASSSFEDDNEENELDKEGNPDRKCKEKSLKPSEKQALIRPPSFKANLKSFCKAIQGEGGSEKAASKASSTQGKSPTSDGYRPSCLSTSKGNNRGTICGQSIVDGGTRADFFHVDAMGSSFLGEYYLDNVRPSAKNLNQKSVSFSDGGIALSNNSSYGDSYNNNNNNCNSSCQSSILPNNKVHPANETVPGSDNISKHESQTSDVVVAKDQKTTPPRCFDFIPTSLATEKSKTRERIDGPPKDFNDVFEVFHDTQSKLRTRKSKSLIHS